MAGHRSRLMGDVRRIDGPVCPSGACDVSGNLAGADGRGEEPLLWRSGLVLAHRPRRADALVRRTHPFRPVQLHAWRDPWISQYWLAECFLALVHRIGGLDSIMVVTTIGLAGLYYLGGPPLASRGLSPAAGRPHHGHGDHGWVVSFPPATSHPHTRAARLDLRRTVRLRGGAHPATPVVLAHPPVRLLGKPTRGDGGGRVHGGPDRGRLEPRLAHRSGDARHAAGTDPRLGSPGHRLRARVPGEPVRMEAARALVRDYRIAGAARVDPGAPSSAPRRSKCSGPSCRWPCSTWPRSAASRSSGSGSPG